MKPNFREFSPPKLLDSKIKFMQKKIKDVIKELLDGDMVNPEEALILYQEAMLDIDNYLKFDQQERVA